MILWKLCVEIYTVGASLIGGKIFEKHTFSSATPFQMGDVITPVVQDNEVLISAHAVEVTKSVCELRSFNFLVK